MTGPDPDAIARFRRDLLALTGAPPARLGVAVSGGPDSMALLLLAASAFPGRVEAATVDHRLRLEGASEAAAVAAICARFAVPHQIRIIGWLEPPTSNVQARASEARYIELNIWALTRRLSHIATAHHTDDQAETLLMRLARGSGVRGLAGVRSSYKVEGADVAVVRPLLGWRKQELVALVGVAGLPTADDSSNRDQRFDRTRFRALLATFPWLDPARLARSAANLADADDALDWSVGRHWLRVAQLNESVGVLSLDVRQLPIEYRRRLLLKALRLIRERQGLDGPWQPRGAALEHLLERLNRGDGTGVSSTLGEVLCTSYGDSGWHFAPAPPRRDSRR